MGIEKRRKYDNYEEYTKHQLVKTSSERLRNRLLRRFNGKVKVFRSRFEYLKKYNLLNNDKNALCMGARMGEEVVAFKELGIEALGVDLQAHLPNVIEADFNDLPFDSETYDIVYTNALDHAFDVDMFLKSVHRVLKKSGHLIVDVFPGVRNYKKQEVFMIKDTKEVIQDFIKDDQFEFLEEIVTLPKLYKSMSQRGIQLIFKSI